MNETICNSLLNEIKTKIKMPSKFFEDIFSKFSFLFLNRENIIEAQISKIPRELKIIIVNKFNIDDKREPKKNYYAICFNYTLIIINQEDSLILQDFFINEKDSKIFYMQEEIQNEIEQLVSNKDPNISLKFCSQEEFDNLKGEVTEFIKLNIFKLSRISRIIKIFIITILAFLIRKGYIERRKFNIEYFNSTIKQKNNIENYVKIRKLQSSQSAGVELVMNIENGQLFALKENMKDNDTLKLFSREKENYLSIDHPLLLHCYNSFIQDDFLDLILEFIDGKTLQNINDYKFDEKSKLKIILSILIIIQYLHFKKYIYRDLKPNNLMIDADNSIVLIDLDQMIENSINTTGFDSTRDFSHDFAAPEIRQGNNMKISEKADIYSIGIIINYIMNNLNILNFKGFPSKFLKLKNICDKCIENNPENRPSISKVISDFISQVYLDYFSIEEDLIKMLEKNLTCSENITDRDAFYIVGLIYSKFTDDKTSIQKSIQYLTVAADQNHADALFCLGDISQDKQKKIDFFSRSAELGNHNAQYEMGIYYIDEDKENYDFQKAFEYLQKSAEQNNPNAQQILGQIYTFGYGNMQKNVIKGINYFKKSAMQKNKYALYFLGVIYYEGQHINRNSNKALKYLEASSDQNFYDAQYFLGSIFYEGKYIINNIDKAIHYATLAANHKKAEAQRLLGRIYINQIPDISIKIDDNININIGFTTEINLDEIDKPLHYFHLAALQNDIKSMVVLAEIYRYINIDLRHAKKCHYYETLLEYYRNYNEFFFNPILIEYNRKLNARNIDEAINILSALSEENDVHAKFALGIIYLDDVYVERDIKKAIDYLSQAAYQNFIKAQIELSRIYVFGRFVEKNEDLGIEYLFKAAKQNDLDSQISLLNYFGNGKYCKPNIEKINEVLYLVENQKNLQSLIKFASICYEGKIIQKDVNKAIKFLQNAENMNCVEASIQLGILFLDKNDFNQAIRHFNLAAEKNDLYGLFYMGLVNLKIGKYRKAFDYFLKSAERKNNFSLIYVALFLLDGNYAIKNVNRAIRFLEISSHKYPQASYILGSIYLDGKHNDDKIRRGRTNLINSVHSNYYRTYFKIGISFFEDKYFDFCVNSAIHFFTNYITKFPYGNQNVITVSNFREKYVFHDVINEIIESNSSIITKSLNYLLYESIYNHNLNAQFAIGLLFYEGKRVKKDIHQSMKILHYSANQNNFNSKIVLGVIYSIGGFIQKDIDKSIDFFSSVRSILHSNSQFICGSLYYEGFFIERNVEKAKFYFENASSLNNCYAKNNLGVIFRNGIETDKNVTNAIKYFQEAIKLSNDEVALYNLAHFYFYEEHIKIDDFDFLYELLVPSVNKNLISAFELLCLIVLKEFGFSQREIKKLENKLEKYDKHSCSSLAQRIFSYINLEIKNNEIYEKLYEKIHCVQLIYIYHNGRIFPIVESDKVRKKISSELYQKKVKKLDIEKDFYDGFGCFT